MLQKVQQNLLKPEWVVSIGKSNLKHLKWFFTPGHAGVKGNERADRLAGSAKLGEGIQMGEREVVSALCNRRLDDMEESETTNRLKGLNIKRGVAAKDDRTGWDRIYHNQVVTGTVSRRILACVLERMTEQVWTCPDCNDVDSAVK